MEKGFLILTDATELFSKLEHDYARLTKDHNDPYKAFNFFVTAEHLPDWVGDTSIKDHDPYLRISSHLATGAKHFSVTNPKKDSVEGASVDVYVENGYVEEGYFYTELVLRLTEKEQKELGMETISLLDLAKEVILFWKKYFTK